MCLLLLGLMQTGPCAISTAGERMHSEVCGKSGTCRPYGKAVTHLPAVSLREKGGVLGGSGICRILPFWDSGSAGKTRDLPTRRRFGSFATVSLSERGGVLGGSGICRILPLWDSGSAGKAGICRPDPGFPRTSGNWAFYQRYAVPSSVKPREPSQGQLAEGRVKDPFWLPRFLYQHHVQQLGR